MMAYRLGAGSRLAYWSVIFLVIAVQKLNRVMGDAIGYGESVVRHSRLFQVKSIAYLPFTGFGIPVASTLGSRLASRSIFRR